MIGYGRYRGAWGNDGVYQPGNMTRLEQVYVSPWLLKVVTRQNYGKGKVIAGETGSYSRALFLQIAPH